MTQRDSPLLAATRSLVPKIQQVYQEQNLYGPISVENATTLINQVCITLRDALPEADRRALPAVAQGSDFSTREARGALQKELFAKNIALNIGATAIGSSDRVFFTCEMRMLSPAEVPFTIPSFEVGSLTMPSIRGVSIREVVEELLQDYEMTPGNRVTNEAYVLPGQYCPEHDAVVLSPSAINHYVNSTGRNLETFRHSVILNELAHASFQRLLESVPHADTLTIDLQLSASKSLSFNIHQLSEAFSDFVSLKYEKDLATYLTENSSPEIKEYALSRFFFRKGLASVLEATPPIIPSRELAKDTFEASAKAVAEYLAAHPEQMDAVREKIVAAYELGLERLLRSLINN